MTVDTSTIDGELTLLRRLDQLAIEWDERAREARAKYPAARERAVNVNRSHALLDDLDRRSGMTFTPERIHQVLADTEEFASTVAVMTTFPDAIDRINTLRDLIGQSVAAKLPTLSRAQLQALERRGLIGKQFTALAAASAGPYRRAAARRRCSWRCRRGPGYALASRHERHRRPTPQRNPSRA